MTIREMETEYRASADLLLPRIRMLRQQEQKECDAEKAYELWRRVVLLECMRREDMEVAEELARYGRRAQQ